MSYADIEDKYETYFNSFKNTMIGLSSFIGLTLSAVGTAAFKYYRNNQINTVRDELTSVVCIELFSYEWETVPLRYGR